MMKLPEREEKHSFLNSKKQEVYDLCVNNLMDLHHEKYITISFYEKLLFYYNSEHNSATSTSEINNTGQF